MALIQTLDLVLRDQDFRSRMGTADTNDDGKQMLRLLFTARLEVFPCLTGLMLLVEELTSSACRH